MHPPHGILSAKASGIQFRVKRYGASLLLHFRASQRLCLVCGRCCVRLHLAKQFVAISDSGRALLLWVHTLKLRHVVGGAGLRPWHRCALIHSVDDAGSLTETIVCRAIHVRCALKCRIQFCDDLAEFDGLVSTPWRLGAASGAVDPRFLRMLVAYEDRRFYSHDGVDLRAMLRAIGQAAWHGRVLSGGSTLTMQSARLLERGGTGAWRGKLRQMRLAWALERHLTKDQILSLYLTLAPYGGNIEGVRAASLIWLGKEPTRLTEAEAALLIALPQSPEARRPDRAPGAARAARDRVLARMATAGVLGKDTAVVAMSDPVPSARRAFPALAPHLTDRLRRADPLAQRHELTLDADLQDRLETLARDALLTRQKGMQVAILVVDHQSGEILASVGSGGLDMAQGHVDMTRALRSPGSTLKPLIYAMGMDAGLIHPETLIADRPVAFGLYAPQNFDGHFRGELRVAEALRLSLNIPVVLLADALGPPQIMAALRASGAEPVVPGGKPGLAVALGGVGITLHDLVQLYAGLAHGGTARPLTAKYRKAGGKTRITGAAAAWQVGHILSDLPPPPDAPPLHIAWKTGTSYGHRDAWAIGWDGQHVVGVWIGRPDGTPVPGGFGAGDAAPILFNAFQRLKPQADPLPPPPPQTLLPGRAKLPLPLQHFPRRGSASTAREKPELAFPPSGATLALNGGELTVKLRRGQPPFSLLANGKPMETGIYRREVTLGGIGKGFLTLTVIDAAGQSDAAYIRLD